MRRTLFSLLFTACTGCAIQPTVMEGNYVSYYYAFSGTVEADIRANAEDICRKRKQLAVRTEHTCALTRCSTSYQCVEETEARELGLLPRPAK